MRPGRRLTQAQFAVISPFLRISDERIQAAYAALVNGESFRVIAERYGWGAHQSVSAAVNAVWEAWERYQESQALSSVIPGADPVPAGWEQATIVAPPELITKFRAEVAALTPEKQ